MNAKWYVYPDPQLLGHLEGRGQEEQDDDAAGRAPGGSLRAGSARGLDRSPARSPRAAGAFDEHRGLPREAAFPHWTDGRFPGIGEIRARLPTQERPLATDIRCKYSNLGATLAGEIAAAVAEQPYTDFVRRRILEPLGGRRPR